MKILITCPPMIENIDFFKNEFENKKIEFYIPKFTQTVSEDQLFNIISEYDGWIVGDDNATYKVLKKGASGKLKAVVKWGIGTDNIDKKACKDLNILFTNTPNMFGDEVADIALGYLIGLARKTFEIDREVRNGNWYKPTGISLRDKNISVVGFGDIGKKLVERLIVLCMNVNIYDPFIKNQDLPKNVEKFTWPENIEKTDFIILTCPLTKDTHHLLNQNIFNKLKNSTRIINVSRGPIIDEKSLINSLKLNLIHSVALDVFEEEPLKINSYLSKSSNCILGSHNASNTIDAVKKTSLLTIKLINDFLKN